MVVRVTWRTKIVSVLDGPDGKNYWYGHKAICEAIEEKYDIKAPMSITPYLQILRKDGHVERALKPRKFCAGQYTKEYIYRRTSKPYVDYEPGYNVTKYHKFMNQADFNLGCELYRNFRQFPKWYRNMMK